MLERRIESDAKNKSNFTMCPRDFAVVYLESTEVVGIKKKFRGKWLGGYGPNVKCLK